MVPTNIGSENHELRLDLANFAFGIVAVSMLSAATGVMGIAIEFAAISAYALDNSMSAILIIALAFVLAGGFVWLGKGYAERNWYLIAIGSALQCWALYISPFNLFGAISALDLLATVIGIASIMLARFAGDRRID